jgi:hypothetical protein
MIGRPPLRIAYLDSAPAADRAESKYLMRSAETLQMLQSAQLPEGSAVGEEVLQQRAALGLEDAATYFYTMVEPRVP